MTIEESKKHVQLPLFEDKTLLPTGKKHISYSELFDHIECSFRHKLKHVDKIELDGPSIHTEYGHAIHDILEKFIKTKRLPKDDEIDEITKNFIAVCQPFVEAKTIEQIEVEQFASQLRPIIDAVPAWMNETFPDWEPVAAEFELFEPIKEQVKEQRYFKGFIDAVIKIPRKQRGKLILTEDGKQEYDTIILDWKTTSWGWIPDKKRDFNKQLQLMLYKHFWCEKFGTDLSHVKCGFVLLKRTPLENDGRVELVPVSLGPKTHPKAIQTMNQMINMVRAGRTIKNRYSCRFCPYSGTKHCP